MKALLMVLSSLASIHAFAGEVKCAGKYVWSGNQGTEIFYLSADFNEPSVLTNVVRTEIDTRGEQRIDTDNQTVALPYKPRAASYQGYNRFALSGGMGWTEYSILLPKNLGEQAQVLGYIQRNGHDGGPTVKLNCEVRP